MPQDFSGQNLRGRNFKGQNLTGANFSHADIQGANFSNAILIDANFTKAKAGMQRRWATVLINFSLVLSVIAGYLSVISGIFIKYFFTQDKYPIIPGAVALLVLAVIVTVTIRQGLGAAILAGAGVIAVAVVGPLTVALLGGIVAWREVVRVAAGLAGASAMTGLVTGAGTVAGAVAVAVAGAGAVAGTVVCTVVVAWPGSVMAGAPKEAITVPMVVATMGIYIAWRALVGDEKHAFVRKIALFFAAMGGTNFRNANLTDANFTQATLKCTKFAGANLTRTRFYEAKKLHLARVGNSILDNLAIRNLLLTGNGRHKSYLGANLRGANLIGADLYYANLKQADITEATFQGANLEWANLTLTQAIGADFTSAQMTGACVESWNIESNTKLDKVDCRFIYLLENRKPGTDDRERRPSSGDFKPGEFTKLFEEVLTTVDLIFDKGIDWKAFIAAFKKVQVENEDTELTIQSIENKGDGVTVVRVSVPPDANKEKIHSDFTQNYALSLKAVEEKYKAELQAKDREIQIYREKSVDMKEIIGLLATRPINVNNEAIATSESKSMSEASKYDQRGAQFAGGFAETVQGDQIGGNIHNYAAPQNLDEAAKYIQQLLQELARLEEKYKSEIAAKNEEIAANRQQIYHLRELAENLAKSPIVIYTNHKAEQE